MKLEQLKLCYVSGCLAYFTEGPVEEVWGDDFEDAPYEHNAGPPYEKFVAAKIFFESNLWEPDAFAHGNSPWSIQDINKGLTPWLQSGRYDKGTVRIYAGTSLDTFVFLIEKASGGKVYLPREIPWEYFDRYTPERKD